MTAIEFIEISNRLKKIQDEIELSNIQSQTLEYLNSYIKLINEIDYKEESDEDICIDQLYENAYLLKTLITNFLKFITEKTISNVSVRNCVTVLSKLEGDLTENIKTLESQFCVSGSVILEKKLFESKIIKK